MYCDAVYEDVQTVKNACYGCQEKSPTDCSKSKSPAESTERKKVFVIIALALASLTVLLLATAASTLYALTKIFKLESVMLEESAQLNASLEDMFLQLQITSKNSSAMIANIDARIMQVLEMCSQNGTNALENELRNPAASCDALPTSSPEGDYFVTSAAGTPMLQYCPPITTRCGEMGRWHSVANLDMTNSTHQCMSDLRESTYSSIRLCVRSSDSPGCSSVQVPIHTAYRSVCGFVRAYQFGQPEAFHPTLSIDSPYVDGVSITYGSPRQHIWTLAAALNEMEASVSEGCPCLRGGSNNRPAFVGEDYFCDTGSFAGRGPMFYDDNPLWDGAGCGANSTCCSFNNPPWFHKEMPQYLYHDIELRVCSDQKRSTEDAALERIEMFVK